MLRVGKYLKEIWIAKKIGTELNEYGTELPIYSKPKKYKMNVQPVSSEADIAEFGKRSLQMQKILIDLDTYYGEFHEFDVVYIDEATPENEEVYGENANYVMYPPRNQRKAITIYLERLENR